MRRGGFVFIGTALIMAAVFMAVGAIALSRATRYVLDRRDMSAFNKKLQDAERGMLEAERWIRRMFDAGETPAMLGVGPSPLRMIEALRADSRGFELPEELASAGVSVYIADTSYDISLFNNSHPPYAIPVIPHIVSDDRECGYFYYIRSSSAGDGTGPAPVFEEVVCISSDKISGRRLGGFRLYLRQN